MGGGIVGISTAYYLGLSGVKSLVVEKDSVGSHASGFAYGSLAALGGSPVRGPTFELSKEGMWLHQELARTLPEETGVNFDYRTRPSLSLVFTHEEAEAAKRALQWMRKQRGYSARWVETEEARSIEPRIAPDVLGGIYVEGEADLEPHRLVVALTQAAERLGATVRHGQVTGLRREGARVTEVVLEDGPIACRHVVLAMGPWAGEASEWLEVPIRVRPLKGQILRLRAPGPPIRCTLGLGGNYATTKPDGLVWSGTTEEEAGFNELTTKAARDDIFAKLVRMLPSFSGAQVDLQTACLRPISEDGLLVLGQAPGWEGVYVATGAGRKGILLGPAMGKLAADLVTKGAPSVPIDVFDPGRFAA